MRRVMGIGGIFFGARDPKALGEWYKRHLGIDVQGCGGGAFTWTGAEPADDAAARAVGCTLGDTPASAATSAHGGT